jgi:hypothetical protein
LADIRAVRITAEITSFLTITPHPIALTIWTPPRVSDALELMHADLSGG